MAKQLNTREALASLISAKGKGVREAWQVLGQANPNLAGHLETLGDAGWPALIKEIEAIKLRGTFAFEALLRAEGERHRRDAREAWETVRGAGGQDNGGDASYLGEVCPTAAQRLRNAVADADAREAAAWFPWTKRKARAAAWEWTQGYMTRSHQEEGGPPAWREDFEGDTRARVAKTRPKDAYAATWEGAAAVWAVEWMKQNRPVEVATEKEDTMPTEIKHPLAILAEMKRWETRKVTPATASADDLPPETDQETFEDLFEDA